MSKNNKSVQSKRLTFSVPIADTAVFDWLDGQYNISTSLRLIIKDYAARYGNVDVSSLPTTISDKQPTPAVKQPETQTASQSVIKNEPSPAGNAQPTSTSNMLDDLMK